MNDKTSDNLARWNSLSTQQAEAEILPCCGSRAWARGVAGRRPLADEPGLLAASDEAWNQLTEADWDEAFRSHPRIGDSRAPERADARSTQWSAPTPPGSQACQQASPTTPQLARSSCASGTTDQ